MWNSRIFMWTVLYLILNFISLIHSHILFHISNTSSHSSLCKTRITFFHFFQLSTAFGFTFWHGGFYLAINSAELYLCNTYLHNLFSLFPPSPSNLCFPVSLSLFLCTRLLNFSRAEMSDIASVFWKKRSWFLSPAKKCFITL